MIYLVCHSHDVLMPTTIFVTRISTDGLRCGGAVPAMTSSIGPRGSGQCDRFENERFRDAE